MKKFIALFSLLLILGCSDKSNIILSYGVVDNPILTTELNNSLVSGEKHIIDSWNLIKETNQIPNSIGIEFGMAYKLNEFRSGDFITVEEIIIFPENGLTNPNTQVNTRIDTEALEIIAGEEQYFSYSLDYEWEAKPGVWVFQVKKDGALLLQKEFHVEPKAL